MAGKSNEGAPLIGPSNEDREEGPSVHTVRLSNDAPLYHALLQDPEAPVVNLDEVREAKSRLAAIIDENPEAVLSCEGKTPEEAREILEAAE